MSKMLTCIQCQQPFENQPNGFKRCPACRVKCIDCEGPIDQPGQRCIKCRYLLSKSRLPLCKFPGCKHHLCEHGTR